MSYKQALMKNNYKEENKRRGCNGNVSKIAEGRRNNEEFRERKPGEFKEKHINDRRGIEETEEMVLFEGFLDYLKKKRAIKLC